MKTEQAGALPQDIRAYLNRIGYRGPLDGSAKTLAGLQEAHVKAVPYENLDILMGVPLSLEIPDLFRKIVRKRRGGYCFELNGLFAWLLECLGYPVHQHMSRFLRDETAIPMRRHRVLKVEAEGKFWLCDVGVGGPSPCRPLQIEAGLEQHQGEESYRLRQDPFLGWIVDEFRKGAWMQYYSFTEEPQLPIDYVMPSYWCEHAPESIFKKGNMISIRTPDGRNTVAGDEFRLFTKEGVHAFVPESEEARRDAFRTYFGIDLDQA
jgi:arylamine N-acetyltransferase